MWLPYTKQLLFNVLECRRLFCSHQMTAIHTQDLLLKTRPKHRATVVGRGKDSQCDNLGGDVPRFHETASCVGFVGRGSRKQPLCRVLDAVVGTVHLRKTTEPRQFYPACYTRYFRSRRLAAILTGRAHFVLVWKFHYHEEWPALCKVRAQRCMVRSSNKRVGSFSSLCDG